MKSIADPFTWSWACPICGDSIRLVGADAEKVSDFGAFVRQFHTELHIKETSR